MGYHPRIESASTGSFLTTRARNSELWFVNNPALERAILGYAARVTERYGVKLYALAIEGNHIQGTAVFPKENRSSFMRDFNSAVACAVPRYTPEYPGGGLWGRRYSAELLPAAEDIERQFFYTVLQPVQDGLVEKLSEYPGYNCFHDAVCGIKRVFPVVRWGEYNKAKKRNKKVSVRDYTDLIELSYERLPGYEALSQAEYRKLMLRKLEVYRQEILAKRKAAGLTAFAGRAALLRTPQGARPKKTKCSTRESARPRVLCVCPKRKKEWLQWYFERYFAHKEASKRYRRGELTVAFPPGMYRPPLFVLAPP